MFCPRRLCDRCTQNWLESGTRAVNIWKAEDGFGKSGVMPENSMEAMNGENFGDINPYLRKLRIKCIFEITIFHCMYIYNIYIIYIEGDVGMLWRPS